MTPPPPMVYEMEDKLRLSGASNSYVLIGIRFSTSLLIRQNGVIKKVKGPYDDFTDSERRIFELESCGIESVTSVDDDDYEYEEDVMMYMVKEI